MLWPSFVFGLWYLNCCYWMANLVIKLLSFRKDEFSLFLTSEESVLYLMLLSSVTNFYKMLIFLTTLLLFMIEVDWWSLFVLLEWGCLTVLRLGQIYYCWHDFLFVVIFYVLRDMLASGFFYWLKLKLLIWCKSFSRNYSFIVFGILFVFLLFFVVVFFELVALTDTGMGLGVMEDSLYFFWLSFPGDLPGDTGLDRWVIDDLYLMGMSMLKLKM